MVCSSSLVSSVSMVPKKKLLTSFCGNPADVEPMTVLLLKVLCDLQRLEEMRFLFTQCVLELDEQPPSTELFNVYLMAISMTDTFNRNEIENVIDLMSVKQVRPDIVTKLSVLILYMRLGQHMDKAWWVSIRDEVRAIATAAHTAEGDQVGTGAHGGSSDNTTHHSRRTSGSTTTERDDLLVLRMRHCFQTMMRLHYDVTMMHECFELLVGLDGHRLSDTLLTRYLLHGIHNMAMPAAHVIQVLQLLRDDRRRHTGAGASVRMPTSNADDPDEDAHDSRLSSTERVDDHRGEAAVLGSPVYLSDITLLRLLAKCAKWQDASSARWVHDYFLARQPPPLPTPAMDSSPRQAGEPTACADAHGRGAVHTTVDYAHAAALLYIHTLAQCGELYAALRVLERHVAPPHHMPQERPRFAFVVADTGKRVPLLHSDPMTCLIHALADYGVTRVLRALPRPAAQAGPSSSSAAVTTMTLDTLMAACAVRQDTRGAETVLASYRADFNVTPTSDSFAALLRAYAAAAPLVGVTRIFSAMQALSAADGSPATPDNVRRPRLRRGVLGAAFLRAAMDVSVRAGDAAVALEMAELHAEHGVSVPVTMGSALLRMHSLSLDATMVRRAVSALRASRSVIDDRARAQARALLRPRDAHRSHA